MRTYIDFMIDEANEAHNVDLRNLPATAPLFAHLHAASLGAVECKYKHVALELAKLAAAYYLQTAEADEWDEGYVPPDEVLERLPKWTVKHTPRILKPETEVKPDASLIR